MRRPTWPMAWSKAALARKCGRRGDMKLNMRSAEGSRDDERVTERKMEDCTKIPAALRSLIEKDLYL